MLHYAFCAVSIAPLRSENKDQAEMVSQLLFGEPLEILKIDGNWTFVRTHFDAYEGWCDTKHLLIISAKEWKRWLDGLDFLPELEKTIETPWGKQRIYRGSFVPHLHNKHFQIGPYEFAFDVLNEKPHASILELSLSYLNTPYLWGGKSPHGIDCSGFTQTVFRLRGKNLPRDAYQQADLGMEVHFEDKQQGDVAFFINSNERIHHVGIILSDETIIHASGCVRIDAIQEDGIYKNGEKTHHLYTIKRM